MGLKRVLVKLDAELAAVTRIRARPETTYRRGNIHGRSLKSILDNAAKWEPAIRDTIDQACRNWIAGRPWPQMDADTAYFVWERFFEASSFGNRLYARGFRPVHRSDPQILAFLLIEHWAAYGSIRLKTRVDSL